MSIAACWMSWSSGSTLASWLPGWNDRPVTRSPLRCAARSEIEGFVGLGAVLVGQVDERLRRAVLEPEQQLDPVLETGELVQLALVVEDERPDARPHRRRHVRPAS